MLRREKKVCHDRTTTPEWPRLDIRLIGFFASIFHNALGHYLKFLMRETHAGNLKPLSISFKVLTRGSSFRSVVPRVKGHSLYNWTWWRENDFVWIWHTFTTDRLDSSGFTSARTDTKAEALLCMSRRIVYQLISLWHCRRDLSCNSNTEGCINKKLD